jgi:hypothetical protein
MSPSSTESKQVDLLQAGFLLGFDPEDWGEMFLQNVG